ncbi:MAG: isoprenylcysteine carboxylmethyltransferase family protein [Sneathiella sp.]
MSDKETQTEARTPRDHPDVKIPPPLCYLAFLMAGIFLNSDWSEGEIGSPVRLLIGALIALCALSITASEARNHGKSGSNVEPWKPTTLILSNGLYAYSRNPIYVGMTITYAGIAFAAGSWIAFSLLPFCLLVIRYHVIAREEVYLEEKFGDEYLSYKASVRRWI